MNLNSIDRSFSLSIENLFMSFAPKAKHRDPHGDHARMFKPQLEVITGRDLEIPSGDRLAISTEGCWKSPMSVEDEIWAQVRMGSQRTESKLERKVNERMNIIFLD